MINENISQSKHKRSPLAWFLIISIIITSIIAVITLLFLILQDLNLGYFVFFISKNYAAAISGGILTIVSTIISLFFSILQTVRSKVTQKPTKITVEIDGSPITIEAHDAEDVNKLLESFGRLQPKVRPSQVKIKARVPKEARKK